MADCEDTTAKQWRALAKDYADLLNDVLRDCEVLLPRALEAFADVGNDNPPEDAHHLVAILFDRIESHKAKVTALEQAEQDARQTQDTPAARPEVQA